MVTHRSAAKVVTGRPPSGNNKKNPSPVDLEMTLDPKPVFTVVVMETAPLSSSITVRCDVPESLPMLCTSYLPPYRW